MRMPTFWGTRFECMRSISNTADEKSNQDTVRDPALVIRGNKPGSRLYGDRGNGSAPLCERGK